MVDFGIFYIQKVKVRVQEKSLSCK